MDLSKLKMSQKIAGGGAVVFIVAYFLPWFSIGNSIYSVDYSGSDVGFLWSTLPLLCALAVLASIAVPLFAPQVDLSKSLQPVVVFGAGALAAFLVILKLIIGESVGVSISDITLDRAWGLFVAAIAAGAMAYGCFLIFKEGGGDIKNIGASMNKPSGGSTPPPPPPPPAN